MYRHMELTVANTIDCHHQGVLARGTDFSAMLTRCAMLCYRARSWPPLEGGLTWTGSSSSSASTG